MAGSNGPRWRVERVSEGAREPIAHGVIPARQDIDDTAIAIATKVGQAIKRGMPIAQAVDWIDLTSATGRRYEDLYDVGFKWAEMRAAIYDALLDGAHTIVIHERERLHITFDHDPRGLMNTITATAYGATFTRNSKTAWTHAVVTEYSTGYVGINWSKSPAEAAKLAEHRNAFIATLPAAELADPDDRVPVRAMVVETTITTPETESA